MAYPAARKTAAQMQQDILQFTGGARVQRWYSDGADEIHAACTELGIRHDIAEPNRHESNGVIERTNRTVIEGARTILYHSGLPYKYWPEAMRYFCVSYNAFHRDSKHGHNPHEQRHGTRFTGVQLVFGEGILYRPNSKAELEMQRKLDPLTREGIFVGYSINSNGRWTETILVIDAEDFKRQRRDSNRRAAIHTVHIKEVAQESTRPGHPLTFPVREGTYAESCGPVGEERVFTPHPS